MAIDFSQFKRPLQNLRFDSEAAAFLEEIQRDLTQDFTPARGGHFSHETMQLLVNMAAEKLNERLKDAPAPIGFHTLRDAWSAVVVDYHTHDNWGFESQAKKPKKVLTENQKVARELFPYFAVLLGIAVIVKTAFFYYGMHTASNPTTENKVWLVITMVLFFGSLFYFAWKKSK